MPSFLVRDLPEETLAALRERAVSHNQSLQKEVQAILTDAAAEAERRQRALQVMDEIRARFEAQGRYFGDSVDLIREDRER